MSTPHRGSAPDIVKPLLVGVDPIAGESVMSLIARACHANVFPNIAALLSHAGIGGTAAFAPFTGQAHAPALAKLLNVGEDEITSRMHPRQEAQPNHQVAWAGARMERRFIEARIRRVSPQALQMSPYHRLEWTNRALSFCPQTMEVLIGGCPQCKAALGWSQTWGVTRCERCKASLLDHEPSYVAADLHDRLKAAANLISSDPDQRSKAQAKLPVVFATWDSGEVFCAMVELGVAWCHPQAGRGSDVSRALSDASLTFTPEHIACGYDVVSDWPRSFGALVGRINEARSVTGAAPSMSLRDLGTIGRLFDTRLADTPLRRLLGDSVTEAALAARAPLKLGGLTHLTSGAMSVGTLTLTQAQDRFAISKKVLSRLVPDGQSLLSGRVGRGGSVRFYEARLAAAAAAYQGSVTAVQCEAVLGVPAYCMDAFCDEGLLERVTDADALLLAGGDQLFSRGSLNRFAGQLLAQKNLHSDWSQPLSRVTERQFSPEAWALVFQGVRSGQIPVHYVDDNAGPALADKIMVDGDVAAEFIARLPSSWTPREGKVTAATAGRLMGIPDIYVGELIATGALAAVRSGRVWRVALDDLMSFSREIMLSTEFYSRVGVQRGTSTYFLASVEPILVTRHLKGWRRELIEKMLPTDSQRDGGSKESACQLVTLVAHSPTPAYDQSSAPGLGWRESLAKLNPRARVFSVLDDINSLRASALSRDGKIVDFNRFSHATDFRLKAVSISMKAKNAIHDIEGAVAVYSVLVEDFLCESEGLGASVIAKIKAIAAREGLLNPEIEQPELFDGTKALLKDAYLLRAAACAGNSVVVNPYMLEESIKAQLMVLGSFMAIANALMRLDSESLWDDLLGGISLEGESVQRRIIIRLRMLRDQRAINNSVAYSRLSSDERWRAASDGYSAYV